MRRWIGDNLNWSLDILSGLSHSLKRVGVFPDRKECLPLMQLIYLELKNATALIEQLDYFEEIQELYQSKEKD